MPYRAQRTFGLCANPYRAQRPRPAHHELRRDRARLASHLLVHEAGHAPARVKQRAVAAPVVLERARGAVVVPAVHLDDETLLAPDGVDELTLDVDVVLRLGEAVVASTPSVTRLVQVGASSPVTIG